MSGFPPRLSSQTQSIEPAGLEAMSGRPWIAGAVSSLMRRFTVAPKASGLRMVIA